MTKNIHDKTFAELLSERRFTEALLKTYLPQKIVKLINWNSLELYKMGGQQVQEKTQKVTVADVIYLAKIQEELGLFWIHFEHQSTPDRWILLRTIQYQAAELLSYAKINKVKKLPPIVTLIYYQGEKPYPYEFNLKSLFEDPAWGLKYFAKPILIDLPSFSDEFLKAHVHIGPIELLLKHIRRKDFSKNYRGIIGGLRSVEDQERRIMLKYLIERADVPEETLVQTMLAYLPEDEGVIMTVAEQLIQKGLQQGMQQGMQEGIQEGMQRGVEQGKAAVIRDLLESVHDKSKVAALLKIDIETLENYLALADTEFH